MARRVDRGEVLRVCPVLVNNAGPTLVGRQGKALGFDEFLTIQSRVRIYKGRLAATPDRRHRLPTRGNKPFPARISNDSNRSEPANLCVYERQE